MLSHSDSSVNESTKGEGSLEPDVCQLSPEELEEEIAELCAHIDAATYRLLRAIGELDRREAWATGFESVAHWLSWRVGIDLVTARQKVRVARALEELPRISEAFRQGKLSYSKVRAMARIATPENEDYLLYIAENGTACHMEKLVRAYRRASRADEVNESRRQRQERYLEIYPDDDGMVIIRGRLPREVAGLLEKALEAAMDALNEQEKATGVPAEAGIQEQALEVGSSESSVESSLPAVMPTAPEIPEHHIDLRLPRSFIAPRKQSGTRTRDDSAESSGELGDTGEHDSAESSGSSAPAGPACPARAAGFADGPGGAASLRDSAGSCIHGDYAQRRVDALGFLAEAALGRGLDGTDRGEPYQVIVHVDSAILADEADDGICELENGDGISGETCRRIACDTPTVTVIRDGRGNLLDIGRKARKISTPLWRALMARDRTCQFPGCARTRHLQAHHIEHWANGGETNPDNLILLCRAHHWAVHEGGIQVQGRAPCGLVFYREDGNVLPVSPPRLPIRGAAGETLKEVNRKHGLELSADTVDRFWDGEAVDYHMAVDGLLSFDEDPSDEK